MISFWRDNTKVTVKVENGPINSEFHFSVDCGNIHYAALLQSHFQKRLWDLVEAIRKEEYEKGYKDGRAKRKKSEYFYTALKRGL